MTREKIRNYIAVALSHINSEEFTMAGMTLRECADQMDQDADTFVRCPGTRPAAGPNSTAVQQCRRRAAHPGDCNFEIG